MCACPALLSPFPCEAGDGSQEYPPFLCCVILPMWELNLLIHRGYLIWACFISVGRPASAGKSPLMKFKGLTG
jgi:hypothetical protein